MTKFLDGPVAGKVLSLKGRPKYLRVVATAKEVDALDQPGDVPKPEETIWVYVVEKDYGNCHICCGGGRGGFYPMIDYKFLPANVPDEILRDNAKWQKWCAAQP